MTAVYVAALEELSLGEVLALLGGRGEGGLSGAEAAQLLSGTTLQAALRHSRTCRCAAASPLGEDSRDALAASVVPPARPEAITTDFSKETRTTMPCLTPTACVLLGGASLVAFVLHCSVNSASWESVVYLSLRLLVRFAYASLRALCTAACAPTRTGALLRALLRRLAPAALLGCALAWHAAPTVGAQEDAPQALVRLVWLPAASMGCKHAQAVRGDAAVCTPLPRHSSPGTPPLHTPSLRTSDGNLISAEELLHGATAASESVESADGAGTDDAERVSATRRQCIARTLLTTDSEGEEEEHHPGGGPFRGGTPGTQLIPPFLLAEPSVLPAAIASSIGSIGSDTASLLSSDEDDERLDDDALSAAAAAAASSVAESHDGALDSEGTPRPPVAAMVAAFQRREREAENVRRSSMSGSGGAHSSAPLRVPRRFASVRRARSLDTGAAADADDGNDAGSVTSSASAFSGLLTPQRARARQMEAQRLRAVAGANAARESGGASGAALARAQRAARMEALAQAARLRKERCAEARLRVQEARELCGGAACARERAGASWQGGTRTRHPVAPGIHGGASGGGGGEPGKGKADAPPGVWR